jgi:hypothetical protein
MEMKDIIIMIVMLAIVSMGAGLLISSFDSTYGNTANMSNFSTTFDKLASITPIYENISNQSMAGASLDESVGFYAFSKGIWGAVKLIWLTPSLIKAILTDFLTIYGLGWIVGPLMVVIGTIIMFLLIWFFWRYRG